jgi:hypothetical protein
LTGVAPGDAGRLELLDDMIEKLQLPFKIDVLRLKQAQLHKNQFFRGQTHVRRRELEHAPRQQACRGYNGDSESNLRHDERSRPCVPRIPASRLTAPARRDRCGWPTGGCHPTTPT